MIIATDLDGTLLSSDTTVSRENLEALKRLYQNEVRTVIATGRTFYEIPPELTECEYIDYFIYSNGAAIYKRGEGVIFSSLLSHECTAGVYKLLNTAETFIEFYTSGIPVVDKDKFHENGFAYYRIDPEFLPEMRRSRRGVENFASLIEDKAFQVEMFDVFFRNMQERTECFKRIKTLFPELEITTSMTNNLEIMNKGIHKGSGLEKLCEAEGFALSDIVALGDSRNDLSLFKAAGRSFAVSNACEELKRISNGIICSNDEHVMCYMEKFVEESVLA